MLCKRWGVFLCLLLPFLLATCSCGGMIVDRLSYAVEATDPLTTYALTGNTSPVLDPSIIRSNSTFYAFSTDVAGLTTSGHLPIRCSSDKLNWSACGSVFSEALPLWIKKAVPKEVGLWAPDVSYFNGEYHVYYCASILNTQNSVIGLATNSTLDPADPAYRWVDRGPVLQSKSGDDFNALDPNIFIDKDSTVWLTYGSYWTGIKQRQIDPTTGLLLASNPTRYDLAERPSVPHDPIEGASLVRHGSYYYLFFSVDFCCESQTALDDYKQAVGRSTSPHGPFVDEKGTPLLTGGGTVLLKGNQSWNAPGGGTVYLDADGDEALIIFHAQNLKKNAVPYQWVKSLNWVQDWPVLSD